MQTEDRIFFTAGQEAAKEALREIVILPALRPEVMLIASAIWTPQK